MRLIRLLLLRSFRLRPARVLLSMFGITLGVAGMLSISVTNQSAMDAVQRLLVNTSGSVRLSIIPAVSGGESLPEQMVSAVSRVAGVQQAVPVLKVTTSLASQSAPEQVGLSFFGANAGGMIIHGVDATVELRAREYRVTSGRFLSSSPEANEIVLVENFAEDKDLKVGQRIGILTPYGVERLLLVGLIAKDGAGLTNNGAFGVAPLRTVQRMFDRTSKVDQVDLLVEESYTSTAQLNLLARNLQQRLGTRASVVSPASQGRRTTEMLNNYQIGLNFLSGVALFVGAYLIYNAFAMTVVERTREFGMLRTVGMTKAQITAQMLLEALILGMVGSALGLALGILLSRGLSQLMGGLLNIDLVRMPIPVSAILTSLALGIGVTLLGAMLPARQAGNVSPIEALRIRGKSREGWLLVNGWKPGVVLLASSVAILLWNPFAYDPMFRLGSLTVFLLFLGVTLILPAGITPWERMMQPLVKLLYGSSGTLGSRNIERSRLRSTITVGALLVGVAMILVVRGMTESFVSDLRLWMEAYLGGDIYVNSAVPLRSTVGSQLRAIPGVAMAAPLRYLPVQWKIANSDLQETTLMAVDPVSYTQVTGFVFSEGQTNPAEAVQRLVQGDAVFLSSVLSEKYGLKPGNTIYLRTRSGWHPFFIAAVVVDFYNNGQMITGSWTDMRRYFRVNDANMFLVRVQPGEDAAEVEKRIDRQLGKRYRLILELNDSLRKRAFSLLDQAFIMFDVLAVISIVVASLGVVNTLTMSVIERRREIGMLRAIGLTRNQVARMVLAEAGIMGLLGGVIGIVLGILLTRLFLFGMAAMSGYKLAFVMAPEGLVFSLVIALVVSQLAALLPALQAARTPILEAVQFE